MNARVELWLRFKNKYRRALSIPLNDTPHFAFFPLAWLSHVAYTIYGSVGYLSMSAGVNPEELDCYTATMQAGNKYYYVAQNPRLLDPDLMEDRTSFATAHTTRRADFRQRVHDRDGICILSGTAEDVQACHIVPHSKGNQYMTDVLNIRSEEIADPQFVGIDDPRNGILLNSAFHRGFGESRVAFLRTPNIFMTVDEVPIVQQPNAQLVHASSTPPEQKRLTFQHFDTNNLVVMTMAPHNCDARLPNNADWPPDVIFDSTYGIAALKKWGTKNFNDFIRNSTRDMYHNDEDAGGDENGGGDEGNRVQRPPEGGRSERAERAANRAKKRNGSLQESTDFHDILLGIWKLNAQEGQRKARAVKAERTKEKVQTWLDSAV